MSEFAQPSRSRQDDPPAPDEDPTPPPAGPARGQGLDSVLDMIDDVLAVDAQEFVRGFVQKGGQ
ncbi:MULTISPECIES: ubiquitin-like protein Pup [Actinomyces]|uniref:Prokaryotic ubiquitin-like protein Pup n=1 Tax=Actinomyces respiraculi TaxID=2744574 RepID=A0A7T0PWB1_9ACTO|nr:MULTISPECIES: ubiquitin-like protein Pup [Actinomyces]QPL06171.1 ubiquitin-like protein Pup [Actinomyces respiraculi]